MIAVQVVDDPTFAAGRQDVLSSAVPFALIHNGYDVATDDQRFVMLRLGKAWASGASRFILVQTFFEKLMARVPN